MSVLIQGARILGDGGRAVEADIVIAGDRLCYVGPAAPDAPGYAAARGATVLDARGLLAAPGLVNAHAHSAMTLLRGAAEDLELGPWLREAIWPREARLTPEDIYWGTRLACAEMLETGTTVCHDMYFEPEAMAEAARDSGMRYVVDYPLIDGMDEARGAAQRAACEDFFDALPDYGPLVGFGLAAHSVYATSAESLSAAGRLSRERGLPLHLHLSETEAENADCLRDHGLSPAAYLDSLGALGPLTTAAHCLWLSEADWDLLAARGVAVIHNPVSNMKLASGPAFDYGAARSRGLRVLLGTDGAASNNGLDLYADAKVAALLQKHHYRDPRRLTVREALEAASGAGHAFFGTGAGALVAGAPADLVLIDLSRPGLGPRNDLAANLVYGGAGAAVRAVFVAGRELVRDGRALGRDTVLAEACARAARIAG